MDSNFIETNDRSCAIRTEYGFRRKLYYFQKKINIFWEVILLSCLIIIIVHIIKLKCAHFFINFFSCIIFSIFSTFGPKNELKLCFNLNHFQNLGNSSFNFRYLIHEKAIDYNNSFKNYNRTNFVKLKNLFYLHIF